MPWSAHQVVNTSPRNSGPLSVRSTSGKPRSAASCSNTRTRRALGSEVSISMARASRVQSSRTLKVRNRTPWYRASFIKSADHTELGCDGTISGIGSRTGTRCFTRRRRLSFSRQYTRQTRLWFQRWPWAADAGTTRSPARASQPPNSGLFNLNQTASTKPEAIQGRASKRPLGPIVRCFFPT